MLKLRRDSFPTGFNAWYSFARMGIFFVPND